VTERCSFLGLAVLLLIVVPAYAQHTSEVTGAGYIFRMSRLEGSRTSCVIVQNNGRFHLEQGRGNGIHVFEGTLPADRLASLNALLNDDRFLKLLPEAVSSSLLPTGLDELVISVSREERWMSLRFLSGMSSEHNRALLDQFLKWNAGVLKSPHKKLSEEAGRNNCLPPGAAGLERRSD